MQIISVSHPKEVITITITTTDIKMENFPKVEMIRKVGVNMIMKKDANDLITSDIMVLRQMMLNTM